MSVVREFQIFNIFKKLGLFAFTMCWVANVHAMPERIGDFALLDQNGVHHQLSYYGDHDAVVVIAHENGNASLVEAAGKLSENFTNLEGKTAQLFLINAMNSQARGAIAASNPGELSILIDEAQMVSETLKLDRAGDVVILDPEMLTVLYRGQLGAEFDQALAERVGELANASQAVAGSSVDYAPEEEITYSKDIAPMLAENCASCHHEGGIGPWAMTEHAMIQGWSVMMREVVLNRRMPPGQIDQHVGKPIADVAGLTAEEQRKLIRWIDAGAPKDDADDPLKGLKFANTKFTLGEPDLVYQVEPQDIPATGVLDYRYLPVNLNLDRDVWVQAMEFVPGDREVLHHVIAYVSSPADRSMRGRQTGAERGDNFAGFAPGRQPDNFGEESGRLLRKGSNLLLQMHYTTSGRATVDATEVGIYLHDSTPKYVMSGGVSGERRFFVPPHVKEHKLEGVQEIERDAYLYEMNPHMHSRGKYMSYHIEYPDGREETLLSVPKYDFNWQFNYKLEEPLFVPAGSKLIARGAMDNSDRNPANPNPNVPVHFGLQTKHEMFFGFTTLRYVGDTPENLVTAREDANGSSAGGE